MITKTSIIFNFLTILLKENNKYLWLNLIKNIRLVYGDLAT